LNARASIQRFNFFAFYHGKELLSTVSGKINEFFPFFWKKTHISCCNSFVLLQNAGIVFCQYGKNRNIYIKTGKNRSKTHSFYPLFSGQKSQSHHQHNDQHNNIGRPTQFAIH